MPEPSISARSAAATSIWPAWPRRVWISSAKGAVEPMAASVDSAPVTMAERSARLARKRPASASAVDTCVPLMSASPSFATSTTGVSPARARAAPPVIRSPFNMASPWPIITAAIWASGARSPEAPTDPFSGITGRTPWASIPSINTTSAGRTPEAPRPRDRSFSVRISRTMLPSSGSPTPQQCDRIRLR